MFSSKAISKFVQCTVINDVKQYFNKLWAGKWRTYHLNRLEHSCDLLSCSLFSFPEKNSLHLQCNLRSMQHHFSSPCVAGQILLCLNPAILPWQHHTRDILHSHWLSALPLASLCPWWQRSSLNCNLFVVHLSLVFVINHAFYLKR